MAKTIGIGIQDFEELITKKLFYVDKTKFIKEWWESNDAVTLLTRPRRFGKTLAMSMLEHFFSNKYEGRGRIFQGLFIWEDEKYRKLQGTFPVISLSFANVKDGNFEMAVYRICKILQRLYIGNYFLMDSDVLTEGEKRYFKKMADEMPVRDAPAALHNLSDYLYRYYGKKVILFLDEYDTPVQEAYIGGYWPEMVKFIRVMFNSAFKTNPYLERAILTGITRISKESIFSDLNNLKVITTASEEYANAFGFTEREVFAVMDEMGYTNKEEIRNWYDGFTFGNVKDIYNPWSITNFLDSGKLDAYWANSGSNELVSKLIQEGNNGIKERFSDLIAGRTIQSEIDEEIVFSRLNDNEEAIWSLLLAGGYLKIIHICNRQYELALTNYEVKQTFEKMVCSWFKRDAASYNDFIKALIADDIDAMNEYMNRITRSVFSYFDVGQREPERFYHGFVLGLMVDLKEQYSIQSNRESGFGRYDILLKPLQEGDAIIIEFKVFQSRKEQTLEETVKRALQQIEEKEYEQELIADGIPKERIRKYGFAFQGKTVLIGSHMTSQL